MRLTIIKAIARERPIVRSSPTDRRVSIASARTQGAPVFCASSDS